MLLSAANFATQAHCAVLFLRLLGLLPQPLSGALARAGSGGGNGARCASNHGQTLSLLCPGSCPGPNP